jgi:hypothetical protein
LPPSESRVSGSGESNPGSNRSPRLPWLWGSWPIEVLQLVEEVGEYLHVIDRTGRCDHPEFTVLQEIAQVLAAIKSTGGAPFLVASSELREKTLPS